MFPLVDRRIATRPRRTGPRDRRDATQNIQHSERRTRAIDRRHGETDRRRVEIDRESLLNRILPDPNRHNGPWYLELLKVGLLPAVVGIASLYVTDQANKRELETSRVIADSQMRTSQIIADVQVRNAKQIAEAELRSQNVANIIRIFKEIIDENGKASSDPVIEEATRRKIGALEVYRDDALPFLVQLRTHFKDKSEILHKEADRAIDRILQLSQPDFSGREFVGANEPLNLRHRSYTNFNLRDTKFHNVNLFRADFQGASLQSTEFVNADLQDADFGGAILRGAVFDSDGSESTTNLRNANFERANLEGLRFGKVKNLEFARFSMYALLKNANQPPFASVTNDIYTRLLMRHENALKEAHGRNPAILAAALEKLAVDFNVLIERFDHIRRNDPDMAFRKEGGPSDPDEIRFSYPDQDGLLALRDR